MKTKKKIKQLEFRLDILRDFINELLMRDKGVALIWWDEYKEVMGVLEGRDEGK